MRSSMRNRRRNLERLASAVPRGLTDNSAVLSVARLLWETLDTPVSLKLSLLCNNEQWEDLFSVQFEPERYLEKDVGRASDDYQAIAFLRKFPMENIGIDREAAAREKFWEAEELCRRTNKRIRDSALRGFNPRVERVLHHARRQIAQVLGDLDVRAWALRCRFGPGVDSLNKGARATAYHKLSRPSVTHDFSEGGLALVRCHPVWDHSLAGRDVGENPFLFEEEVPSPERSKYLSGLIHQVPGNRVTFVPKTALTLRSIAVEPGLNIFAQLGLGALLRSRLKRAGLNLDDQRPNQVLAYRGSRSGQIATVDLSMASDTVATELVRDLIPAPWFTAMDWCRSKMGTIRMDGQQISVRYEKFSSMGNGFTFELESLLFWAIALGVFRVIRGSFDLDEDLVRAYGDDIAIPTDCVELLGEVLDVCGFRVNSAKSYAAGVFRESCGSDFFNGMNVRPFFLKEYCGSAESLFRLANGVRRVAYRRNRGYGCDRRLLPLWLHIVQRIPNSLRDLRIPFRPIPVREWDDVESGDGGLASNLDEALSSPWVTFNRDLQVGWLYAELQARPVLTPVDREQRGIYYLYALYAGRDGVASETTTPEYQVVARGERARRLNSGVHTPDWFELGPWV